MPRRGGALDGAWWPRSRDLLLELPSLAAEIDGRWGRITRITVNPAQWPVIPRRIPVTGHTVHAGWYTTEQDEHMIMVCSYAPRRLELLVVPPRTDSADAARLMAEAADPANTRTASELLAADAADAAGGGARPAPGSGFLPSSVAPPGGADAADRRAGAARSRAASWPAPQ
ncbi:DUF5994 family protein [Kitasatospora phosalacinea]|uniref:DUF5994 family protein n=1 Tax=Kitasatospora phosalacinea TaxID=2065 RepID=UPI00068E4C3E|nr:DUF5994 family protein [Kitasatospora phosalacinea]